ncbi:MAG: Sugar phosphate isomerase/epimerase [Solirubrobacterales bacterium]|nr:Sugar phosphate isomerase/epimerase [Solirubrobacterales bacterium]
MLRYAYNTNGLQNHRLEDAVGLLAEAGYDGVALTLDVQHLDPALPSLAKRAFLLRQRLDDAGLGCVIETGARYVLDPRRKHEPTLVSPTQGERDRRIDFLVDAIEVAHVLEAECVSCFAGIPHELGLGAAREALLEGLGRLNAHAAAKGVRVALEPEPGMAIADLDDVLAHLPEDQWLALDVGHCLVTQERDPAGAVREFAHRAATVTVEDMKRGEHVHLPFGEGDLDLPAVLRALTDVDWRGLVCVELSRESHRAHELVPASIAALRAAEAAVTA